MWTVEDSVWVLVSPSTVCVGPRNQAQTVRLVSGCLYQLSHPTPILIPHAMGFWKEDGGGRNSGLGCRES